jgi:hypothetical protein
MILRHDILVNPGRWEIWRTKKRRLRLLRYAGVGDVGGYGVSSDTMFSLLWDPRTICPMNLFYPVLRQYDAVAVLANGGIVG